MINLSSGNGNIDLDGELDANSIATGDVVVGPPLEYQDTLERVRMVAGGIRLIKTSKSDNEQGIIRVSYNVAGDTDTDLSLQDYMDRSLNLKHYREFYPADT